jgi:hypothetical protein
MSGDARITGRIAIRPAVTWGELHDKPWATGRHGFYPDVVVDLDTIEEHTQTGVVYHHSGVAIVPTGHETNGYELLDEVGRIVDAFKTAPDGIGRVFAGFLHVVWAGGKDVYRVVVRAGRAVEVRPQMVWPDGARDEDSVEPGRAVA